MRRRTLTGRRLSAAKLVRAAEALPGHGSQGGTAMHDQYAAALRDLGYSPVDYFRARLWLRRGKPAGWRWDHG